MDPRRAVIEGNTSPFLDLAAKPEPLPLEVDDLSPRKRSRPVGGWPKRMVDVAFAATVLVLLTPIICVVALVIKATMGGPVLFSHRRVGYDGVMFGCLKFRTMVKNGDQVLAAYLQDHAEAAREWAQYRKLRKDPRVTAIGTFLRRSSLDELPQLINVIRGEMSCVGPRPVMLDELEKYGAFLPDYLQARPGLTGLWQVTGRSDVDYNARVQLDAEYVRHWSLWKDLVIMAKTVPAVLNTSGSC